MLPRVAWPVTSAFTFERLVGTARRCIGGVATRADCRRRGYASIALNAVIQTMHAHDAAQFALLFCEPHNFEFYRSRGWQPFIGDIYAEQPEGRIRFEAMSPFVFDLKRRAPVRGTIDLGGLPW
jgi:ribosomal protein S18 acetylase RimI-like enzyme